MATKICCTCKNIKAFNYFSKNSSTNDGLAKRCKECVKNYYKNNSEKVIQSSKEYYECNKEKVKKYKDEYYLENKEALNKISKKYYEDNKEEMNKKNKDYNTKNKDDIQIAKKRYYQNNKYEISEYQKQYRVKNKEQVKETQYKYRIKNKEQLKTYNKNYAIKNKEKIYSRYKDYLKSNNNAKIKCGLRSRFSQILKSKGHTKSTSITNLLGCSIDFFITYIEEKFTNNMNWDNYGKYGWHLDHIIPCSSFDLSLKAEQEKCFHYTNMQPLWATTEIAIANGESTNYLGNLEKQNKIIANEEVLWL